ncbi:hypothetical protein [Desulfobacca acetoxidans]|nr:hypothetical protein [Desulfobacca acetoxidans]
MKLQNSWQKRALFLHIGFFSDFLNIAGLIPLTGSIQISASEADIAS